MKSSILCLSLLSSLAFSSHAYSQSRSHGPRPALHQYGWASEAWTGDDRPYQAERADIDRQISAGKDREKLFRQCRVDVEKRPGDAVAVYRWGYSGYRSCKNLREQFQRSNRCRDIEREMDRVRSPRTYEYVRLRFLVQVTQGYYSDLAPVAERLFKRNPKDEEVVFRLRGLLCQSRQVADLRRAVQLGEGQVQRNPAMPGYLNGLGVAYHQLWHATGDVGNADKAVKIFNQCLKVVQSGSSHQEFAARELQLILDEKAQPLTSSRK